MNDNVMNDNEEELARGLFEHAAAEVSRAVSREMGELVTNDESSIRVTRVAVAGPYTMVMVRGPIGGTGVGFAKRTPTDEATPTIGVSAASFRAVRDYLRVAEYNSVLIESM